MHQHRLNDEQTADLATKIVNMIHAAFGSMPRTHDMELLPLAIAHGNRWGTIIHDEGVLYTIELLSVEKQETVDLVLTVSHVNVYNWRKTELLNEALADFCEQNGIAYGHFGAARSGIVPPGYQWI